MSDNILNPKPLRSLSLGVVAKFLNYQHYMLPQIIYRDLDEERFRLMLAYKNLPSDVVQFGIELRRKLIDNSLLSFEEWFRKIYSYMVFGNFEYRKSNINILDPTLRKKRTRNMMIIQTSLSSKEFDSILKALFMCVNRYEE